MLLGERQQDGCRPGDGDSHGRRRVAATPPCGRAGQRSDRLLLNVTFALKADAQDLRDLPAAVAVFEPYAGS